MSVGDGQAAARRARRLIAAVLLVMLAARPAHAYTDPGSGLLLWQGLMAALVGAGFYFRKFFYQVFSRKRSDDPKK